MDDVILAGTVGPDAPWAHGFLRPFLPLPGTTVIEALLRTLREAFDGTCTIYANSHPIYLGLIIIATGQTLLAGLDWRAFLLITATLLHYGAKPGRNTRHWKAKNL